MTPKHAKSKKSSYSDIRRKTNLQVSGFYAARCAYVERVKLFGFDCLRFDSKVFAKLHKGNFVMKLPPKRVASLNRFRTCQHL